MIIFSICRDVWHLCGSDKEEQNISASIMLGKGLPPPQNPSLPPPPPVSAHHAATMVLFLKANTRLV